MAKLSDAIQRIDAANSNDPTTVTVDGTDISSEVLYGQRMTEVLGALYPNASDVLQLAVRAQHLRRWEVPRQSYPMNRAGYLDWRSDLKAKHAEWAGQILADVGYSAAEIDRVGALIRKENLKNDAEAQALEDVAAIVFLKHYSADFVGKHPPAKVKRILAKTFAKMSPLGRSFAQELTLPDAVAEMVRALTDTAARRRSDNPDRRRVAAVLVAHGDRAGDAPNANLIAQAAAIRALADVETVVAGVLKGEPSLEEAVEDAVRGGVEEVLIYPLFMADGFFIRKMKERLEASPHGSKTRVLPPLGLDPRLPPLLQRVSVETAGDAGLDPLTARLVVAGHGSKVGPASADATRWVADRITSAGGFRNVEVAFLEEAPFVADVLAGAKGPTVVAGLFFGDGMHAGEDVPEAMAAAEDPIVYTGAIGASPRVTDLIADALNGAADPS